MSAPVNIIDANMVNIYNAQIRLAADAVKRYRFETGHTHTHTQDLCAMCVRNERNDGQMTRRREVYVK